MMKIISITSIVSAVFLLSACHDIDYYDYQAPTPPVTYVPSHSNAYYAPAPSASRAYYAPPAYSGSSASYGGEPLPPVSVSPSSGSGASYG